jgi:UDP-glucose 4-epimerase
VKKILITGGTGFIGSHLANYLILNKNYDVTICDNNYRGKIDDFVSKIKYVDCDLTKKEEYKKLGDYDVVYHLAAINGTKNFYKIPYDVLKVNTLININLIEWCKEKSIQKILYTSSSEVYASTPSKSIPTKEDVLVSIEDVHNPRWSYAGSKILGELMIINSGLNFSIVRPHNIYGPRMGYDHVIPEVISRILEKENPFKIYGFDQTRSFCFIDDAVKMLEIIMNSDLSNSKIINLGVDDEIKIIDLIEKMFQYFNYFPELDIVDPQQGSVDRRCPDVTSLNQIIDKIDKTTLNEGLEKTCEWYENSF